MFGRRRRAVLARRGQAMPSAHWLIADAGHRPATWRNTRSVLAFAADTQRRSRVGLLGPRARYLPRPVARGLASFLTWRLLASGDVAYDAGGRAALGVIAPDRERRLRRSAIWCGSTVLVAASVQAVSSLLLPDAGVFAVTAALVALYWGAAWRTFRLVRRRGSFVGPLSEGGRALVVGPYVAPADSDSRLMADLVAACDRAGVVVTCEVVGEADRLAMATERFRVVGDLVPPRPAGRLRPARPARELMVRMPVPVRPTPGTRTRRVMPQPLP